MADYYKLTSGGERNRHTDWTSEIILERDDDGNPSKVISATRPAQLTADDQKKVEDLGYKVSKVSKGEAEEILSAPQVGGDITGAAPVFGDSGEADQSADDADAKK